MRKGFRGWPAPYAPVAPGGRAYDLEAPASGALLIIAGECALFLAGVAPVACLQNHGL